MLNGYKTYITAIASILYAVCGGYTGYIDWSIAIPIILGAFGISALHAKK